jgi:hypothetical protein
MSPKIVGGNDENSSYNTRLSLKRKQALLRSNLPAIRFTTENIALAKSRVFSCYIHCDLWLRKPGTRRVPKIQVPSYKVFPVFF